MVAVTVDPMMVETVLLELKMISIDRLDEDDDVAHHLCRRHLILYLQECLILRCSL